MDSPADTLDAIRRVSSHEDFNSNKHFHVLPHISQDMGHGVVSYIIQNKFPKFFIFYLKWFINDKLFQLTQRCPSLPLHERTNVSPISKKLSPVPSSCEVVSTTDKFEGDVERIRNSERFSRSLTPRGRRQARRRRVHKTPEGDHNASKVS